MKRFYSIAGLVVVAFLAFGGVIKYGSLQAQSDNSGNIVIQWQSEDESNVGAYYVQRSASASSGYQDVSSIFKPRGNYFTYQFTDYAVFKTTETNSYFYRIRIEGKDNSESYSDHVFVTHTTSGVRRTWGSLKAMFR